MENKSAYVILCAAVSIIVVASVLMPIINDAVDDSREYYNNAVGTYAKANDNVSISYGSEGYFVNDESVQVGTYDRLIVSPSFYVERNGATTAFIVMFSEGVMYRDTVAEFDISYSNQTLNVSYVTESATRTADLSTDWLYFADDSGDYRITAIDNGHKPTVYLNSINDLTVIHRTNTDLLTFHEGAANIVGSTEGAAASVEYSLTDVDGVKDVVSLKIAPTIEESDFRFIVGEDSFAASAVIVPYEVFGEKDASVGVPAILLAIPPVVLIAIALFVLRFRD